MNIRTWLNDHSGISISVTVLVLAGAFGFLFFRDKINREPAPKQYFYDLGATQPNPLDRLFPADQDQLPPIEAPSGAKTSDGAPTGVRAAVYSCGECTDRESLFIGYLETCTKEYNEAFEQHRLAQKSGKPANMPLTVMSHEGQFISRPEKISWVAFTSLEARDILAAIQAHCGEEPPHLCTAKGVK